MDDARALFYEGDGAALRIHWTYNGNKFNRACKLPDDFTALDVQAAWDSLWESMECCKHV